MKERICRDGDENLYSPKIHSEKIRELFRIGQETGLPITVLVDYSVGKFIEAYNKRKLEREEHQEDNEFDSDPEDLSTYLEPYRNDPNGEGY
jgi:hypothetical protein